MAGDPTEDIRVVIRGGTWMSRAETEITAEAAVGEGAMVKTPTPPHQDGHKLGAAERTNTKEVGRRRRDDGLRGMGKPPWGQPLAPTGEGGASHSAPTEEGEKSVGMGKPPWGQPSPPTGEAGASHLAPTEEGEISLGTAIRRPQEKLGPAIGAHRP